MNREGSLHLVRDSRGQDKPQYSVSFSGLQGGGPMKARNFVGEAALRDFLIGPAHVRVVDVDVVLKDLRETGNGWLHVVFSDEELVALGLVDETHPRSLSASE